MEELFDLRELLQTLGKQYWLSTECAKELIEKILEILSKELTDIYAR